MPAGRRRTATAPASMARNVVETSRGSVLPLTMTIGVGYVSMIRRVASKPSSLGIWMSMVMTSGCLRATGESSTTRTLIMGNSACSRSYQSPDYFQQVALVEATFHDIGIGADVDPALAVLARLECRHQHDRHLRKP